MRCQWVLSVVEPWGRPAQLESDALMLMVYQWIQHLPASSSIALLPCLCRAAQLVTNLLRLQISTCLPFKRPSALNPCMPLSISHAAHPCFPGHLQCCYDVCQPLAMTTKLESIYALPHTSDPRTHTSPSLTASQGTYNVVKWRSYTADTFWAAVSGLLPAAAHSSRAAHCGCTLIRLPTQYRWGGDPPALCWLGNKL